MEYKVYRKFSNGKWKHDGYFGVPEEKPMKVGDISFGGFTRYGEVEEVIRVGQVPELRVYMRNRPATPVEDYERRANDDLGRLAILVKSMTW